MAFRFFQRPSIGLPELKAELDVHPFVFLVGHKDKSRPAQPHRCTVRLKPYQKTEMQNWIICTNGSYGNEEANIFRHSLRVPSRKRAKLRLAKRSLLNYMCIAKQTCNANRNEEEEGKQGEKRQDMNSDCVGKLKN